MSSSTLTVTAVVSTTLSPSASVARNAPDRSSASVWLSSFAGVFGRWSIWSSSVNVKSVPFGSSLNTKRSVPLTRLSLLAST